jgi:cytochrome b involved in lipid metabolism
MAVYDKVYDVTSFVHPGGSRILESYCGMDATVAWEAVRHHKSQGLNAKLATVRQTCMPLFDANSI